MPTGLNGRTPSAYSAPQQQPPWAFLRARCASVGRHRFDPPPEAQAGDRNGDGGLAGARRPRRPLGHKRSQSSAIPGGGYTRCRGGRARSRRSDQSRDSPIARTASPFALGLLEAAIAASSASRPNALSLLAGTPNQPTSRSADQPGPIFVSAHPNNGCNRSRVGRELALRPGFSAQAQKPPTAHRAPRGGRPGLLVLTAGPVRYFSADVTPPARWQRLCLMIARGSTPLPSA